MNIFENIFNLSEDEFRKIMEAKDDSLNIASGDHAVKEIGDRVIIWDYSSVTNINGIELAPWDYDDFNDKEYYVVIACNQVNTFDSYFILYKQDLVVVHPRTKKQYRVSSKHVRLL